MNKEEVIHEDDTLKVIVIPNLLRITIIAKTKEDYERYKDVFKMLPSLIGMFRGMTE